MTNRKNKEQENSQPQDGQASNYSLNNQPETGQSKNGPTPPSANGKRAYQSLPQVVVRRIAIEGTPVIQDRDMAISIFRSYFTPEVWVQMHVFAMYTDNWDKLLCIRRINAGSAHNVQVDVQFLIDLGVKVRARHISLALTRTSGNTDSSYETDEFLKAFAEALHLFDMHLDWFFIMSQNGEDDIASELSIGDIVGPDPKYSFILQ